MIIPVDGAAGFRKTGIYQFDQHIFTEEDFIPSAVADRLIRFSEESRLRR